MRFEKRLPQRIRKFVAASMTLVVLVGTLSFTQAAEATGAGSTFVYPILSKWAEAYRQKTDLQINYQSIGSGGGIAQIKKKTVDFGASDMPLKPEDLEAAGLTQFPIVIGGDVPVVNMAGIKPGELKLTGTVLANIFLGKITKWNDPAIVALNKDLKFSGGGSGRRLEYSAVVLFDID